MPDDQQPKVTSMSYALDLAGQPLRDIEVGHSVLQSIRALGHNPEQLLVRWNGILVQDPALVFPRPADLVTVDYRLRGA